ncbi:hypothetical protein BDV28DRAFT_103711 [Aspergillus coremiiformis]|uniref:Uncharacterized protein n=1 Tax=Aspergillus coremiiformis TaxID=138285 RepID=A0A5N6ZC61_9EURO|nr:hypothetical protein BDV28DRAFT_103711 [Aspergillus coremiiformis]
MSSSRLPTPGSNLYHILIPRPPSPFLLPLQSVWLPVTFHTPRSVQVRLNGSIMQDWKGTSTDDHVVNRRKKNDTTDPTVEGDHTGVKDREQSEEIVKGDKPQAATERGGAKHGKNG